MNKLSNSEKVKLFDSLFNQERIQVINQMKGYNNYEYIHLKMWNRHLSSGDEFIRLETEESKETLLDYLKSNLN